MAAKMIYVEKKCEISINKIEAETKESFNEY